MEKDGLPGLVSMLAIMIAIFTAVGMQFIAQEYHCPAGSGLFLVNHRHTCSAGVLGPIS